jgi:predicted MFS family arabinose efflux permease
LNPSTHRAWSRLIDKTDNEDPTNMQKDTTAFAAAAPVAERSVPTWMVFFLATACGLVAADLYYAQPLIGIIAPEIGLSPSAASLIVTLTQIGYCSGLLLLVPMGDLVENRRLVLVTVCGVGAALLTAALSPSAPWFLAAALLLGLGTTAVQMLIPLAAHMAPEASRGRVVGNVMSGLLLGIMLARPVSSMVAYAVGWRAVFAMSAGVMVVLAVTLRLLLPERRPTSTQSYAKLIGSMWTLLRTTPILQRRATYQALLFAAFSLFWTTVPLELAGPTFNLTQRGIALFALAGAAGAIAAPIAGRLADRGFSRIATGICMTMVGAAWLIGRAGGHGSLASLVVTGILIDLGVQGNMVLNQRAIFALPPQIRSRLNGLYMAIFFFGGAVGSAIASRTFTRGGWESVSWVGLVLPAVALLVYATEFLGGRKPVEG